MEDHTIRKSSMSVRVLSAQDLTIRLTTISELTQDELTQITELVNDANRARPSIFSGDRLEPESLSDKYLEFEVLLLRVSDLAGCILMKRQKGELFLALLAVKANCQGLGLGSFLIKNAIDHGLRSRCRAVKLDAVRGPLVEYYGRFGFKVEAIEQYPVGHWGASTEFELAKMTLHF